MEVLMEEIWRNTRQQKQKSIAFPNCRERERVSMSLLRVGTPVISTFWRKCWDT
jgi:hypothetical protein